MPNFWPIEELVADRVDSVKKKWDGLVNSRSAELRDQILDPVIQDRTARARERFDTLTAGPARAVLSPTPPPPVRPTSSTGVGDILGAGLGSGFAGTPAGVAAGLGARVGTELGTRAGTAARPGVVSAQDRLSRARDRFDTLTAGPARAILSSPSALGNPLGAIGAAAGSILGREAEPAARTGIDQLGVLRDTGVAATTDRLGRARDRFTELTSGAGAARDALMRTPARDVVPKIGEAIGRTGLPDRYARLGEETRTSLGMPTVEEAARTGGYKDPNALRLVPKREGANIAERFGATTANMLLESAHRLIDPAERTESLEATRRAAPYLGAAARATPQGRAFLPLDPEARRRAVAEQNETLANPPLDDLGRMATVGLDVLSLSPLKGDILANLAFAGVKTVLESAGVEEGKSDAASLALVLAGAVGGPRGLRELKRLEGPVGRVLDALTPRQQGAILAEANKLSPTERSRIGAEIQQAKAKGQYPTAREYQFTSDQGRIEYGGSANEVLVMHRLDNSIRAGEVQSWTKDHDITIPYEMAGGKGTGYHYPDVEVVYTNGDKKLIEVKGAWLEQRTADDIARRKAAGEKWAKENGYEYIVATEEELGRADIGLTKASPQALTSKLPEHQHKTLMALVGGIARRRPLREARPTPPGLQGRGMPEQPVGPRPPSQRPGGAYSDVPGQAEAENTGRVYDYIETVRASGDEAGALEMERVIAELGLPPERPDWAISPSDATGGPQTAGRGSSRFSPTTPRVSTPTTPTGDADWEFRTGMTGLAARSGVGGLAGAGAGAATAPEGSTPQERLARAAAFGVAGATGAAGVSVGAAETMLRLADAGTIRKEWLSAHPDRLNRARALLAAAAQQTGAGQVVRIPPGVLHSIQAGTIMSGSPPLPPELLQLVNKPLTREQMLDAIGGQTAWGRVAQSAKEFLADAVSGLPMRQFRREEYRADLGRVNIRLDPNRRRNSLQNMVDEVAEQLGVRPTRVQVEPDAHPNAYAPDYESGRPLSVTQGLLDLDLTDDELATVVAHELAHANPELFRRRRFGAASERLGRFAEQAESPELGPTGDTTLAQDMRRQQTEMQGRLEQFDALNDRIRQLDELIAARQTSVQGTRQGAGTKIDRPPKTGVWAEFGGRFTDNDFRELAERSGINVYEPEWHQQIDPEAVRIYKREVMAERAGAPKTGEIGAGERPKSLPVMRGEKKTLEAQRHQLEQQLEQDLNRQIAFEERAAKAGIDVPEEADEAIEAAEEALPTGPNLGSRFARPVSGTDTGPITEPERAAPVPTKVEQNALDLGEQSVTPTTAPLLDARNQSQLGMGLDLPAAAPPPTAAARQVEADRAARGVEQPPMDLEETATGVPETPGLVPVRRREGPDFVVSSPDGKAFVRGAYDPATGEFLVGAAHTDPDVRQQGRYSGLMREIAQWVRAEHPEAKTIASVVSDDTGAVTRFRSRFPSTRYDESTGEIVTDIAELAGEATPVPAAGFDPAAVKRANATSRTTGKYGEAAVVPKYVEENLSPDEAGNVLDFGAGNPPNHANRLRENGYDVTAHEFGENQVEGLHDPAALTRQYDTVYASRVLNVQESQQMLDDTLAQMAAATKPDGRAIFNYPEEPRKWLDADGPKGKTHPDKVLARIRQYYGNVERVGGTNNRPIWEATQPIHRGIETPAAAPAAPAAAPEVPPEVPPAAPTPEGQGVLPGFEPPPAAPEVPATGAPETPETPAAVPGAADELAQPPGGVPEEVLPETPPEVLPAAAPEPEVPPPAAPEPEIIEPEGVPQGALSPDELTEVRENVLQAARSGRTAAEIRTDLDDLVEGGLLDQGAADDLFNDALDAAADTGLAPAALPPPLPATPGVPEVPAPPNARTTRALARQSVEDMLDSNDYTPDEIRDILDNQADAGTLSDADAVAAHAHLENQLNKRAANGWPETGPVPGKTPTGVPPARGAPLPPKAPATGSVTGMNPPPPPAAPRGQPGTAVVANPPPNPLLPQARVPVRTGPAPRPQGTGAPPKPATPRPLAPPSSPFALPGQAAPPPPAGAAPPPGGTTPPPGSVAPPASGPPPPPSPPPTPPPGSTRAQKIEWWGQKIQQARYATNLLFKPAGAFRDMGSTLFNLALLFPRTLVTAGFEEVGTRVSWHGNRLIKPEERSATFFELEGLWRGLAEGHRQGAAASQDVIRQGTASAKSRTFGTPSGPLFGKTGVGGVASTIMEFPYRIRLGSDAYHAHLGEEMARMGLAYREAGRAGLKRGTQAFDDFVQVAKTEMDTRMTQMRTDAATKGIPLPQGPTLARTAGASQQHLTTPTMGVPVTGDWDGLSKEAFGIAQRLIFQGEAGTMAKSLGAARKGGLEGPIPFFTTLANLSAQAIEMHPVTGPAGALLDLARSYAPAGTKPASAYSPGLGAGKGTTNRFTTSNTAAVIPATQRLANATLGAGVAALGYTLVQNGLLTDMGPHDASVRRKMMNEGWRPLSVPVKDADGEVTGYLPLAWLVGPMALALGFGAQQGGYEARGENTDLSRWEAIASHTSDILFQQMGQYAGTAGLRPVYNLVNTLMSPDPDEQALAFQSLLSDTIGSYVPLGGVLKAAAELGDRYERDPRGIGQELMAGIPGLSGMVPERTTEYGDTIDRGDFAQRLYNYLSPATLVNATEGPRKFFGSEGPRQDAEATAALNAFNNYYRHPDQYPAPTDRQRELVRQFGGREDILAGVRRTTESAERRRRRLDESEGGLDVGRILSGEFFGQGGGGFVPPTGVRRNGTSGSGGSGFVIPRSTGSR